MADPIHTPEEINANFEELSMLESEFEDVEIELIRKTDALHAPLYKKRATLAAKIPHFWALVFEQSPPELDNFLQPSDSNIFAECLKTINVSRFEIETCPRSFQIDVEFSENEWFEDRILSKKFWFRKSSDGWQGHVSEPVKINWKKGKDTTGGLTDAAYTLFEARQELAKKGDVNIKETTLPEYKALATKIEQSEEASNSFFAWFAFVASYRWISAEESEKACKAEAERREMIKRGEKVEEEEPTEENEQDFQETEVFPQGDEVATLIAEDVWPSAIQYYKRAHEADDEELSEIDEDFDEDDDQSDEEIDIRGLVGKGRISKSNDSPPSKKQRKS